MALAFALQTYGDRFGKGDIRDAVSLCKLIADIEPEYRGDCKFYVFTTKTAPIDLHTQCVQILSEKFPAEGIVGMNYAKGHPYGSNMLWVSAMGQIDARFALNKKLDNNSFPYDGVLTFEPDCVPLRRDWINALTNEWNTRVIGAGKWTEEDLESNPIKSAEEGRTAGWPKIECMGHRESNHINGNMILRPDIHKRNQKLYEFTDQVGWDYFNQKYFMRVGVDTDLILQHYRRLTISRPEMPFLKKNGVVPALFHGCKSEVGKLARTFVREILIDRIPQPA